MPCEPRAALADLIRSVWAARIDTRVRALQFFAPVLMVWPCLEPAHCFTGVQRKHEQPDTGRPLLRQMILIIGVPCRGVRRVMRR